MKLIKTTPAPPDSLPRFKPRRSARKLGLSLWMISLSVAVIAVLVIFAHVSTSIMQTLSDLSR